LLQYLDLTVIIIAIDAYGCVMDDPSITKCDDLGSASLSAIEDPVARRRALKWLARMSFLSCAGSTVVVVSLPAVLNAQQTGDPNEPSGWSAEFSGLLGAAMYFCIALFSKVLPTVAEVHGHRPQLMLSCVGSCAAVAICFCAGVAGGSTTAAGVGLYFAAMAVSGTSSPFSDFVAQITTEICAEDVEDGLGYLSGVFQCFPRSPMSRMRG